MRTNLRFFNVMLVGVLVLTALLGSTTTPAKADDESTPDLFISEYIEGSSNNKAIEIYNPTAESVDLAAGGYKLEVYFNGASTSSLVANLTGTVATGDVFIFAHSSATQAVLDQADQTTGSGLFNGDDAVVLKKGETILDVIGQVSFDPGTEWGSGLTSTLDHTLRRKVDVCVGDTNPSDVFDPSLEWDGFVQDTFDGLGSHAANCGSVTEIVINEVDSDTDGIDALEFVELYDGGVGNSSLNGLVVVFFNGSSDTSYAAYDLDTYSTDENGYFLLGNSGLVPTPSITFADSFLQNGADAVALYAGEASNFPNGTTVTITNLIDAVVYDTDDIDDAGLLPLLNAGQPQVDEAGGGDKDNQSNQRCPNGTGGLRNTDTYTQSTPTPGAANACVTNQPIMPTCPASIIIEPGESASEVFSAVDADGVVVSAVINSTEVPGISISGLTPATVVNEALTGNLVVADTTAEGVYSVELLFTNNDGTPQTTSCTIPVTIAPTPGICTGDTLEIGSVQGEGTSTPFGSQSVTVSGVVTSVYQGTGELGGFFIQDTNGDGNDLTSDGIFVYTTTSVAEGDIVQVTGTASERFGNTQISAGTVSQCTPMSVDLPTTVSPVNVSFPLTTQADLEYYEGMLVTFPQDLTISEYFNFDRYGEIVLSNGRFLTHTAHSEPSVVDAALSEAEYQRNKIVLDDGRTTQNPDPAYHPNGLEFTLDNLFRGGDTVQNVTGTIYYDFSLYRVVPTIGADYTSANPRTAEHEAVGGSLKVASFNVLNYFTTLGSRGADTAEEFNRQRDKIIAAVSAINADVVGLIEIENNTEAIADLVNGLNEAMGAGTYAYVDTGVIGTDEIKVAFIYKPATVSLVGGYEILDSSVDPTFIDTLNRPVLAQTFQETATGGVFTVAVNHLKSKGSACDGDPDLGDGAGNCNLTRTAAAEGLVDWLATDPTGSGDPDFLIIGDLNAYDKEDPIDSILEGADDTLSTADDYTDLIFNFIGEDAYSYVFDGRIGYLDHALANQDLFAQVSGTTIWHINADEADLIDYDTSFKQDAQDAIYAPDGYRSSDHDPVIIGLSLDIEVPSANGQDVNVNEDDSVVIDLTGSDNETPLNELTFTIVDEPTNGVLSGDAPNVTYTPNENYNGPDSFTFIVNDGTFDSAPATVNITVAPVNDNPVAVSDSGSEYAVAADQILTIAAPGILTNDSDVDGDPLESVLVDNVFFGTLTLNSDGSFTYDPNDNYVGLDTFTYKASDGDLESNIVTVTITVTAVPVTGSDIFIYLPIIFR